MKKDVNDVAVSAVNKITGVPKEIGPDPEAIFKMLYNPDSEDLNYLLNLRRPIEEPLYVWRENSMGSFLQQYAPSIREILGFPEDDPTPHSSNHKDYGVGRVGISKIAVPVSLKLGVTGDRDELPPMAMPETGTVGMGVLGRDSRPAQSSVGSVQPNPLPKTVSEKREVSRLDEGMQTALEQIELSWDYIFNRAKKLISTNVEEKKELDYRLKDIERRYAKLPKTLGAATVGNIGTNIVSSALPITIGGLLGGAPGAKVATGMVSLSDIAMTVADANMEMDEYEASTGKKLSDFTRTSYLVSSVATDLIMDAAMGSPFMKKLTPSLREGVTKQLQQHIFRNPVSQQEFNVMTQQVLRNELPRWGGVFLDNAARSGIGGGVGAGLKEAGRSIYTHEAPELSRIVTSTLTGLATGMVHGGVSTAVQRENLSRERYNNDDIYYVSRRNKQPGNEIDISEFRPTEVVESPDGRTSVRGNVVEPGGDITSEQEFPIENISGGSYREAHKSGATDVNGDDVYEISPERLGAYNDVWRGACGKYKNEDSRAEAYAIQNDVVQGMAAEMGIPVTVYASIDDMPERLRNNEVVKQSYGVTVEDDEIMIVLDQCQDLTADNLAAILRHEAVGHFGLPKLYEDEMYYENLMKMARPFISDRKLEQVKRANEKSVKKWLDGFEELASMNAETRPYLSEVEETPYKLMYDMLRRSEKNLQNMTMGEKRLNFRREGNPMDRLIDPSPYLEWLNKYRSQGR